MIDRMNRITAPTGSHSHPSEGGITPIHPVNRVNPVEKQMIDKETYSNSITPKNSLFDLRLGEIWRYRDLLVLFVRRDFVSKFKQMILRPL